MVMILRLLHVLHVVASDPTFLDAPLESLASTLAIFHLHLLLRHVTRATTMPVWKRSKPCTTPCKCQHCTTGMKKRATSGYRNSLLVTLKTFLTQSSSTSPRKSTRGTSERDERCQVHQPGSLLTFILTHRSAPLLFKEGLPETRL